MNLPVRATCFVILLELFVFNILVAMSTLGGPSLVYHV